MEIDGFMLLILFFSTYVFITTFGRIIDLYIKNQIISLTISFMVTGISVVVASLIKGYTQRNVNF